ncbi:MAG: AAA family ATPase, partial [Actinophytocola sp.]|nr:AAA family ATPase [Actinophytocola sp.]
ASAGRLEGIDACDVLLSSGEESVDATQAPRLVAAEANLDKVHFIAPASDDDWGLTLPDDIAELAKMIQHTGARIVIIDPITTHLASGVDSHKDAEIRRAVAPLATLAHALGITIVIVAHLNKSESADLYVRLAGSSGFYNLARSVLLLTKDPEADEDDNAARLLTHGKCNVGPQQPALRLRVVGATIQNA